MPPEIRERPGRGTGAQTAGEDVTDRVHPLGDLARKEYRRRFRQLQVSLARMQYARIRATRGDES